MKHTFIAIEGPIGVGKTSLTRLLADHFVEEVKLIHEDVSNPHLTDFYNDVPGSAFRAQLHFLISRHAQLMELSQRNLFYERVISDFMFEKDKIFAYLTLDDGELGIYEKLYKLLSNQISRPDLVVYLQANLKTLKKRIAKRGRDFEKEIDIDYLGEVCKAYQHYFYHYSQTPLLVVNTDEIDFVNNRSHLADLIQHIEDINHGTVFYNPAN